VLARQPDRASLTRPVLVEAPGLRQCDGADLLRPDERTETDDLAPDLRVAGRPLHDPIEHRE